MRKPNPPTPPGSTGCESLAGRLPQIPFILGFRHPDPPPGGGPEPARCFYMQSSMNCNLLNSKYNPYTLRAARRPCLYALAMPAPPPITRVATLSSLLTGTMGPKGIKWDPRGDPRGDPRAPSAPFGGMGPGGPLGLFRSHSEWKAISNGKQLRMEGHSEIKAIS